MKSLPLRLLAALLCLLCVGAHAALPLTTERDPALPAVTLGGYRFHAQAFGDAARPVLIVLHGGPGADHRYLLPLQTLADDHRVVFYDQRGTGLSPRVPAAQITPQTFIDDLDAFVDAFGQGRPVHLLGHSWGAMLASAYTGQHPHKVARLVLAEPGFLDASTLDAVNPGGWPGWAAVWGVARAWVGQWFVDTGGDPYARADWFLQQVLQVTQGPEHRCPGHSAALPAWRAGSPDFQATIGRMMDDPAWGRRLDFRRGTDRFEGPVLFIAGACSQVMGERQQRRHLRHFRHAELVVVPDAGHALFNDQPAATQALVRRFLGGGATTALASSAHADPTRAGPLPHLPAAPCGQDQRP